jgi:protein-disulfide isomerase
MSRNSLYLFVLVAIVGLGAFWFARQTAYQAPEVAATTEPGAETFDPSIVREMSLGNPDAKVTVIEYASFTCPHCKNFHEQVFGQLKVKYIETGKINFIYREVYFDRPGLWAGVLARCGGPDRYFAITDLIYDQQSEWTATEDPAVLAANLRGIGIDANLSEEQMDACFADDDKVRAMVAIYQQNAEADNVRSSPMFLINGERFGNMGFDEFAAVLDKKLAE